MKVLIRRKIGQPVNLVKWESQKNKQTEKQNQQKSLTVSIRTGQDRSWPELQIYNNNTSDKKNKNN